MRQTKLWISTLILVVIGLHAIPVLSWEGNRQTRWPILSWAMYAKSFPPGPIQTVQRRIIGMSASGHKEEVTARQVGVSGAAMLKLFIQPMWTGDSSAARQLAAHVNRGRSDRLVELWIEGEKYTIADTGVVREDIRSRPYRVASP